ncbi:MAG: hypothetical protein ACREVA_02455 [Burkholderiales bacterium]
MKAYNNVYLKIRPYKHKNPVLYITGNIKAREVELFLKEELGITSNIQSVEVLDVNEFLQLECNYIRLPKGWYHNLNLGTHLVHIGTKY